MINKANLKKIALGVLIAAAVADAGYRLWPNSDGSSAFSPGQMPPCDSSPVRRLLVQTIEESPQAVQNGLKLLRLGDVGDFKYAIGDPISNDPKQEFRFCAFVIFTNAGKTDLYFKISWVDAKKGTLWLETQ
jgi:hypothetical protein